jgi:uncharacterized protein
MEFQYFERDGKQLYTIYHSPKTFSNDDVGIVLCYPFGQEYIRCHKLYVNLAKKLTLKGYHVLRFDYYGTGDSSGEFESFSIKECLLDIDKVIEEMKETCGISKIILIGLRFGATLSLMYSQKSKVDGIILWNPIFNGSIYLKMIEKEYKKWLQGSFARELKHTKQSIVSFGYVFTPKLTEEIKSISLNVNDLDIDTPILVIDEHNYTNDLPNIKFENTVNKEFWLKRENESEKTMVPAHEINKILDWIVNI